MNTTRTEETMKVKIFNTTKLSVIEKQLNDFMNGYSNSHVVSFETVTSGNKIQFVAVVEYN